MFFSYEQMFMSLEKIDVNYCLVAGTVGSRSSRPVVLSSPLKPPQQIGECM